MPEHDYYDEDELEPEEIEAYCMSCRQHVIMEDPQPVWTKRGAPGTRGHCDICGTTVFRMGKTEAHAHIKKPRLNGLKKVSGGAGSRWGEESDYSTYINYTRTDGEIANRLANDLAKVGVPAWVDPEPNGGDKVAWAGGVHPALEDCKYMVVILSEAALESAQVTDAWTYFRQQNKPVVVAQIDRGVEVPDTLRRRPRFDFSNEEDYRQSFRALLDALSG